MCGIVGWFCPPGSQPDPALLDAMTDSLAHRGPDGRGVWIEGSAGLGHRRLSIVDVAHGAQPMLSADGSHVITFNGEIYNHLALRPELERKGHRMVTSSDTETLVHAAQQHGALTPSVLNGMFAYAVWDRDTQTLRAARDRMGQKPLYYAQLKDGSLLLASEPKALLRHPEVEPRIDREALALYLTYEYVPAPYSAFAGIRKLAPGQQLTWRHGELRVEGWASALFGRATPRRSADEWIADLRNTLGRSVERRLMSDVPLGVFLSGGIDSSTLVALMAEQGNASSIETFSIAFDDPSFDESSYARQVAGHFGTKHREHTFTADDLIALLPSLTACMDEPFADASLLPTHLLSCFTRESVTVALGGDGGDELLMGYSTFRADPAAEVYSHTPGAAHRALVAAVDRIPVRTSNFSLDFVAKSFMRGAHAPRRERHARWLSSFLPGDADDPLLPEHRAALSERRLFDVMGVPYDQAVGAGHDQAVSAQYLATYLPGDILTKVDRASMATSLEVRAPFLDPECVRVCANMPARLKRGPRWQLKYALKEAMRGTLPDEILDRKKKGFGIPVAEWLKGPLRSEMQRLLAATRIEDAGIFDSRVVDRLVAAHLSGKRDCRKQLWTLMMFEYWREEHGARL